MPQLLQGLLLALACRAVRPQPHHPVIDPCQRPLPAVLVTALQCGPGQAGLQLQGIQGVQALGIGQQHAGITGVDLDQRREQALPPLQLFGRGGPGLVLQAQQGLQHLFQRLGVALPRVLADGFQGPGFLQQGLAQVEHARAFQLLQQVAGQDIQAARAVEVMAVFQPLQGLAEHHLGLVLAQGEQVLPAVGRKPGDVFLQQGIAL